ncbi:uncharacterized protein DNG_09239 [Cephalotrichum gorgonifer]|uniref:Uncharacterized protein n=1 Tax=Cephalotrichum gorgonifer TaxID=2041049 RepID=A0AAE8N6I6_9PEZI|nr:uncharacterized protein DNG_09239 [Cephalotrichum gorgonifer]
MAPITSFLGLISFSWLAAAHLAPRQADCPLAEGDDCDCSNEFATACNVASDKWWEGLPVFNSAGTNLIMKSPGCVFVMGSNTPLCQDGTYNINDKGVTDNMVTIFACLPDDHQSDKVKPGCQADIVFPNNYGEILFQQDNCVTDAGGNQLGCAKPINTDLTFDNPYKDRSTQSPPDTGNGDDQTSPIGPNSPRPKVTNCATAVAAAEIICCGWSKDTQKTCANMIEGCGIISNLDNVCQVTITADQTYGACAQFGPDDKVVRGGIGEERANCLNAAFNLNAELIYH